MGCYGGVCHTCWGIKSVVVGLVFVANWYWNFADWWLLVGVLFVLAGLLKLVKPTCPHCSEPGKAAVASRPMKKGR